MERDSLDIEGILYTNTLLYSIIYSNFYTYSKEGNTTKPNSFYPIKIGLLRWNLNPLHAPQNVDVLTTEIMRLISWLGRVKAIQRQPI